MRVAVFFILLGLLIMGMQARAQTGEPDRIGNVFSDNVSIGIASGIGESDLPVCTPVNYACNTPQSLQYIFIGSGNWDIPSNWLNEIIPPASLQKPFEIFINPTGTNRCVLNIPQAISEGTNIHVMPGKILVIGDGKEIE